MKRGVSITLVFCLLIISFSSIRVPASADFKSTPSNLESLKNSLGESLAIIKCGVDYGVGFAGNWNLSQDQRNQGINTLFFTSKTLVDKCSGSYRSLIPGGTAKYKSKEYDIKKWGWNLDGTDFATVASSVNVPTLNLFGRTFPEIGWWVIVAYYVKDFGIVFKESRIQLVEKEQFILGIDSVTPAPMLDGVVFDNEGNFLGVITTLGNPIQSGLLRVHGAPRQCNVSGTSGGTITNCSVSRNEVWRSISPNSTPTSSPSPSIIANDASREALDSYKAALESFRLYSLTSQECLKAFQVRNPSDRKLLSLVSGSQICRSEDSNANSIYQKVLSLGKTIDMTKDPQSILNLIDAFNDATDRFNLSITVAEDGIKMADGLRNASIDFAKIESRFIDLNSLKSNLDYVLDNVPSKIADLLKRDRAISDVFDIFETIQILEEQFEEMVDELDYVIVPDPDIANSLTSNFRQLLIRIPSEMIFASAVNSAVDEVPNFYCQKKKRLALPTNGKCAAGFKRRAIDK